MTPNQFNKQTDSEKWDTFKSMKGTWVCWNCKEDVGEPKRCVPFPGTSLHCGTCDEMLTRRTGGGQHDPFYFLLKELA